jgi:hypothetical protein
VDRIGWQIKTIVVHCRSRSWRSCSRTSQATLTCFAACLASPASSR